LFQQSLSQSQFQTQAQSMRSQTTPPLVYKSVTTHNTRTQSFHEVVNAGPATSPLDFPTPMIGQVEHWSGAVIINHKNGRRYCSNILVPQQQGGACPGSSDTLPSSLLESTHAFVTKKKLAKKSDGQLRLCILLRPCQKLERTSCQPSMVRMWETTDKVFVIKSSLLKSTSRNLSILCKDPLREVSAQQFLGCYSNVLSCHEAFQDDEYVYKVLPHCAGGDLNQCLREQSSVSEPDTSSVGSTSSRSQNSISSYPSIRDSSFGRVEESRARKWFCQILGAIAHFQKKGVCHGGLSLDNIFKDNDGNLQVGDFGLSMRIPYNEGSRNLGGAGVTDVSDGSSRRLIRGVVSHRVSRRSRPKPLYMAPEMYPWQAASGGECLFDGFSVDLWALGVILFIMLTGSTPFGVAHERDTRYVQISEQGLLHKLDCTQHLSPSAVHLLQSMLMADPSKRPSLSDILVHPWLQQQCHASAGTQTRNRDPRCSSKRRLHHLSFVGGSYLSFCEAEQDRTLERGKALQHSMRMASF